MHAAGASNYQVDFIFCHMNWAHYCGEQWFGDITSTIKSTLKALAANDACSAVIATEDYVDSIVETQCGYSRQTGE